MRNYLRINQQSSKGFTTTSCFKKNFRRHQSNVKKGGKYLEEGESERHRHSF